MCAEQLKGSLPKGVFAVNITSLQLISTEFFIGNFYPSDHCLASEKQKKSLRSFEKYQRENLQLTRSIGLDIYGTEKNWKKHFSIVLW